MWKKSISVLYILFMASASASAQIITETEATPSAISEPGATFLITEINYKNATADWVKMKYFSPSGKPMNIKNISFVDDSVLKTINDNILIASGQELLLTFKSDQTDSVPYLFSSRSGLTGTTEQFIVYDGGMNILDAICWTSDAPTTSEISDMAELYENEGWESADIFSCTASSALKTDESLIRRAGADTNSRNDWATQTELASAMENPTVSPVSTPVTQTESITDETFYNAVPISLINPIPTASTGSVSSLPTNAPNAPASIQSTPVNTPLTNLDTSQTTKLDPNAAPSSSKKSSSKTSYANGNLSPNIILTEIMPNPDGTDTKKEWIELQNNGDEDINLGNWTLDDAEDGSKPYIIPSSVTVKAGETLVLESKDTKLSLANGEDEVRLFDFTETMIDSIGYESAPSGESYSKITVITEQDKEISDWIWTADITPEKPNPVYLEITAEITKEPQFESSYYFEAADSAQNNLHILFSEDIIAAPLAKAGFLVGTKVKLLLEPDPEDPAKFTLKKYEILENKPVQKENNLLLPSIGVLMALTVGGAFYLLRNKIPWQDMEASKKHLHEEKEKL